MVLQRTEPTEEQTSKEQARQADLQKSVIDSLKGTNVMDGVMKDLGLSPEPKVEEKPVPKPKVKEPILEEEPEPIEEEPQEEEVTDDNAEQATGEEETEEEEVIPKSKVQKRFDELTAKNKYLEQQIEEIRASKVEPKDEVTKQLEAMTTDQLKAARLEVRKAQIKAQNDDSQLNELLNLEEKINTAIQDAPANFVKAQQAAFSKKAERIAQSGEIPDMEKHAPQILKIANELYQEYTFLHKDINGQATALDLAVKHFKAIHSVPGDKTKETELKRQNNNLKRKVTLDTKTGKNNADKSRLDSLVKNAMGGTMRQKEDLVRFHPMFNVDKMIPDEFKK